VDRPSFFSAAFLPKEKRQEKTAEGRFESYSKDKKVAKSL
jgi:hypothetical protein